MHLRGDQASLAERSLLPRGVALPSREEEGRQRVRPLPRTRPGPAQAWPRGAHRSCDSWPFLSSGGRPTALVARREFGDPRHDPHDLRPRIRPDDPRSGAGPDCMVNQPSARPDERHPTRALDSDHRHPPPREDFSRGVHERRVSPRAGSRLLRRPGARRGRRPSPRAGGDIEPPLAGAGPAPEGRDRGARLRYYERAVLRRHLPDLRAASEPGRPATSPSERQGRGEPSRPDALAAPRLSGEPPRDRDDAEPSGGAPAGKRATEAADRGPGSGQ